MKLYLILVAAGALALVPAAPASNPAFSYEGGFLYGGLEAFYGPDACANGGLTDGLNSDCFALDGDYAGRTFYFVDARDDSGLLQTDPSRDVPPALWDPAMEACRGTPASADCPTSGQVLFYPLIAACFYAPTAEFPMAYFEVLGCNYTGEVPEGAGLVSVVASGGVNVSFKFVIP